MGFVKNGPRWRVLFYGGRGRYKVEVPKVNQIFRKVDQKKKKVKNKFLKIYAFISYQ